MDKDGKQVTIASEHEIALAHIRCDCNDANSDNIIIEIKEVTSFENDQDKTESNSDNTSENQDFVDSPDLISIKDYRAANNTQISCENVEGSETITFCETLYQTEASNTEFQNEQTNNTDGEFLTLSETPLPEDANIIEDIPNEVLVYTCQPETDSPLDIYPCKSCNIATGCIFCLKSHYESVHLNLGLIQYKCQQTAYLKYYTEICHKCNLVCESKQEMFDHRKIHYVSCDICDMSFDSALFLSNHCKTSHEKFEVIISCDLCEQWFEHLQNLSDHYQDYHEMILCIVCFKRFSNTAELVKHHSTHKIILTDVKPILPYACSKCNMAFGEIGELSSHLVKSHPNRKASYGSIIHKKINGKVKRRKKDVQFDDCGGLSQEDIVDSEDESISTNTDKLETDHS